MNWLRLSVVILSVLRLAFAGGGLELLFEEANKKYLEGNYAEAIRLYESILENGYESDKVYYNLGNAYYRIGKLGKAILFYEKALKLNPNEENARFNLKLVNLQIRDRVEVPPPFFLIRFYQSVKNMLSSNDWALSFAFTFLLSSLLGAIVILFPGGVVKKVVRNLLVVVVIVSMIEVVFLIDRYSDEKVRKYGVVVVTSLECLSAPQEGSTVLFVVHEGVKVKVLGEEQSWFRIELPDGKQGWVKRENVGVI